MPVSHTVKVLEGGIKINVDQMRINEKIVYVDPLGTTKGMRGCRQYPYNSIIAAIEAAQSGDTVVVTPGTYSEGANRVEMSNDVNLVMEPGAVWNGSYPDDGVGSNFAILKPGNNAIIRGLNIVMTSSSATATGTCVGAGHSQSGFTNVIIENARITCDGAAFYANSSSNCTWTLINPIVTAPACYIQGNGNTSMLAVIINPLFDITAASVCALGAYAIRRPLTIGISAGKFVVIGGRLIVGGDSVNNTPSLVLRNKAFSTSVDGAVTMVGTLIDVRDRNTSISADFDMDRSNTLILSNVRRLDGLAFTNMAGALATVPFLCGMQVFDNMMLANPTAAPTIDQLLLADGKFGVIYSNRLGLPVIYYTTDGANVLRKDLT
jgi:hypothetical protein